MFDDLALTFYNNVVAAYDEYVGQRDSPGAGRDRHLRTAVETATQLYHFREHLPPPLKPSWAKLSRSLPDFELMRGVANAAKHKVATQQPFLVANAQDIREVTKVVRYSDEHGQYSHVQTAVHVTCTDGVERWLDPAITRVLNFWGELLKGADVCGYTARAEPMEPGSRFVTREEAVTNFDLEAMRGLDFRQSMQLLEFDTALGSAVPVDLTGADLEFRVYKPPQQVLDLTLSHPDHGDVTASVPLSEEDSLALHRVGSQAEREAVMERLFHKHRSTIEQKLREQLVGRRNEGHVDKRPAP